MSTTYKSVSGDDFNLIAKRCCGDDSESWRIYSANPDIVGTIPPGTTLIIPDLPSVARRSNISGSINSNLVTIIINGTTFRHFESVSITRSVDTVSAISFSAPTDIITSKYRTLFRPFTYPKTQIYIKNELIFTGMIVGVNPDVNQGGKKTDITSYSLAGILADCTMPASAYPLEFYGQKIPAIANKLIAPFGISAKFNGSMGSSFEQVALGSGEEIFPFLVNLSQKRGVIITDDAFGGLVFGKPEKTGPIAARFKQDVSPVIAVNPSFNSQQYFSHITGIQPTDIGLPGSSYTVKNPKLGNLLRPHVYSVPDTPDADVKQATKAKMSRMFGNAASYLIEVCTWRDKSGSLWVPGSFVSVTAPDAMIYSEYVFYVRSVTLNQDSDSETAVMNLAMPGSFSGDIPEVLPWEG